MRKLLVGKEVSFVPEYTVTTTTPPREYGSIWINGQNVAELGVKEGWLKVREGKPRGDEKEYEETIDRLRVLEEDAQSQEKGLWNTKEKV